MDTQKGVAGIKKGKDDSLDVVDELYMALLMESDHTYASHVRQKQMGKTRELTGKRVRR